VAVLCLVLLVLAGCSRKTDSNADLAGAVSGLDRRITVARISAFPYRSAPEPVGPSASPRLRVTDRRLLQVRATAARIVRATSKPTHDAAIAAMVAGDASRAVTWLEALLRARPTDPALWSDLAAARFEKGTADDDPAMHASALAAADAALRIDPRYAPALFNRALALEALALRPHARRALERYLAAHREDDWSGEVRQKQVSVAQPSEHERWEKVKAAVEKGQDVERAVEHFPQQCRTHAEVEYLGRWAEAHLAGDAQSAAHWLSVTRRIATTQARLRNEHLLADAIEAITATRDRTLLARAHLAYRKARLLYRTDTRRVSESLPVFREAERSFAAVRSPMAQLVAYYRANALFDAQKTGEAAAALGRLLATVPGRHRALRAQLHWLQATIAANRGEPYAALNAAREAASQFRDLGENENAATMEFSTFVALRKLGRLPDSHHTRRRAFALASRSGKPSLLERGINNAARDEVLEGRWAVAASLFALEIESDAVSPLLRADALLWHAVARATVDGAPPDVRAARAALVKLPDPTLQQEMEHEIRLVEGSSLVESDPARAVDLLSSVIEFRRQATRMSKIAAPLVERGRARRVLGRVREAESDFRSAIAADERAGDTIVRDDLRDGFLGGKDRPYEELLDLLISDGRLDESVRVADAARMRGIAAPEKTSAPAGSLPADTVVLHYTTLPRHTLLAVMTHAGQRELILSATRRDLLELQRHLQDEQRRAAASHHLHELLIAPIAKDIGSGRTLVIVPDVTLAELPFAMLTPSGGKALIESNPIVYATSAASFLAHTRTPAAAYSGPAGRSVIADPAFDPVMFPALPRLASARGDARSIAAATVLVGAEATPAGVLEALEKSEATHVAAHAIADEGDAWKSLLVLTPDSDTDGALYLHQIARRHLPSTRLVTLAACRTGALGGGRGTLRSLSRAFLAAGAHNVVATLWDVDDQATSVLMQHFYRALDEGHAVASALREAQLTMMRSPNPRWASPRVWASVQLYGCNR
jgi:CHAT domain-containing protein